MSNDVNLEGKAKLNIYSTERTSMLRTWYRQDLVNPKVNCHED